MWKLNSSYRVRDYDKNQYVLEKYQGLNKARTEVWVPVSYFGTIRGLVDGCTERIGDEAATLARVKAVNSFKKGEMYKIISNLPEKKGETN